MSFFHRLLVLCPALCALCLGLSEGPAGAGEASRAAPVYPGCAEPPATPRHVWRIDPVHGRPDGDGSAAHPWNSLQAVVSAAPGESPLLSTAPYWHAAPDGWTWAPNPDAPVKPGDALMLMSGDYGDISVNVSGRAIENPDFVTVEAAPGETPVFRSLSVGAANKWRFKGVKVQSPAKGYEPLVRVGGQGAALPSADVILDGLDISSADSVEDWTQADWLARARWAGLSVTGSPEGGSSCTSISNTTIHNVRFGVILAGDKTLFTNNRLNYLGDDFLDYAANDLIISRNTLTNSLTLGDGNHQDFMQGQIGVLAPGTKTNHFHNIVIDRNLAIRQTDPNLKFPGEIQGIDAFNVDWHNLTVSNNIVITSACHGISYASVHGGLIVNNTLLDDDSLFGTKDPGGRVMCRPWIFLGRATHEGSPSNDTVVRNNVANVFDIDTTLPGVVMDHNLCPSDERGCTIVSRVDGKRIWNRAPGVYGDGAAVAVNIIAGEGPAATFVHFDPKAYAFDVRLKPGTRARGGGNPDRAPSVDFEGAERRPPPNIGAY
ncbi:parallel beta helix pectate lyase-like protein [Roseiarcus fermentans]|uniref:Parallel beta helix pectate lyase-like protein n=1 Tax=Roseiarcus fermentans TaxID=1473586 RepID=A0A366FR84_9HYPH|nr:right-handed parallel beta-helix repeat-containing protein [Roseiarcus fermentans]RBP17194.1 parallel beta helix pectate lyase-like protein [Roseiarcus fermentans]